MRRASSAISERQFGPDCPFSRNATRRTWTRQQSWALRRESYSRRPHNCLFVCVNHSEGAWDSACHRRMEAISKSAGKMKCKQLEWKRCNAEEGNDGNNLLESRIAASTPVHWPAGVTLNTVMAEMESSVRPLLRDAWSECTWPDSRSLL